MSKSTQNLLASLRALGEFTVDFRFGYAASLTVGSVDVSGKQIEKLIGLGAVKSVRLGVYAVVA